MWKLVIPINSINSRHLQVIQAVSITLHPHHLNTSTHCPSIIPWSSPLPLPLLLPLLPLLPFRSWDPSTTLVVWVHRSLPSLDGHSDSATFQLTACKRDETHIAHQRSLVYGEESIVNHSATPKPAPTYQQWKQSHNCSKSQRHTTTVYNLGFCSSAQASFSTSTLVRVVKCHLESLWVFPKIGVKPENGWWK